MTDKEPSLGGLPPQIYVGGRDFGKEVVRVAKELLEQMEVDSEDIDPFASFIERVAITGLENCLARHSEQSRIDIVHDTDIPAQHGFTRVFIDTFEVRKMDDHQED